MEKFVLNGYESIKLDKSKTCCFSGHRKQHVDFSFEENSSKLFKLSLKLENTVEQVINCGVDTFLCGMALGFDTLCAKTILKLKGKYKKIKLICVLPCRNQEELWEEYEKNRYRHILSKSDWVICNYDNYFDGCNQIRDDFMVDNSSCLICFFNGRTGGTSYTLSKAKEKGLKIFLV